MPWTYSFDERAFRELRKLDRPIQQEIITYLDARIATAESPRRFGKALRSELEGLWRYRVGDYRLLCRIEDRHLVVLVISVGHRRDIYR